MERGLMWLPLLGVFIWLAWAGWNEYQKVEAYRLWASSFERAKYDVLAVLGQLGDRLTWGMPTRRGPVALQSIERGQVRDVQLWVNDRAIALDEAAPSTTGRVAIALLLQGGDPGMLQIPFTDATLAYDWAVFLRRWLAEPEGTASLPNP